MIFQPLSTINNDTQCTSFKTFVNTALVKHRWARYDALTIPNLTGKIPRNDDEDIWLKAEMSQSDT